MSRALALQVTCTLAVVLVAVVLDAPGERRPSSAQDERRLVWSDEFTGRASSPPDRLKWSYDVGADGWGNDEMQAYTSDADNVALDGRGHLKITAREQRTSAEGDPIREYSSARITTKDRFDFMYGQVEARIKVPRGQGLWPAFWMLGRDIDDVSWPESGEIDIMEARNLVDYVSVGLHGPVRGGPRYAGWSVGGRGPARTDLGNRFHTYGVNWSRGRVTFLIDGLSVREVGPAELEPEQRWVFDKPFFLLLNVAVGGRWPGSPDSATDFPQSMLVDWVRVYQ